MAKVPNAVETLAKISTGWVGCTNVTDRQTTDGRATAYSERERQFTLLKIVKIGEHLVKLQVGRIRSSFLWDAGYYYFNAATYFHRAPCWCARCLSPRGLQQKLRPAVTMVTAECYSCCSRDERIPNNSVRFESAISVKSLHSFTCCHFADMELITWYSNNWQCCKLYILAGKNLDPYALPKISNAAEKENAWRLLHFWIRFLSPLFGYT